MLEIVVILCFIITFLDWGYRGKSYYQLNDVQKLKLKKKLAKDRVNRKRCTPESYLPVIQKRIKSNLKASIFLLSLLAIQYIIIFLVIK